MQINNISSTDFNGKAKFLSGLKRCEKDYAKKLLNYEIDGKTNKAFLSEKNFDLGFFDSKQNQRSDILYLSTPIKYLVKKGNDIHERHDIQLYEIDIISDIKAGAEKLRGIIEKIGNTIENSYPTQYNTRAQKRKIKHSI